MSQSVRDFENTFAHAWSLLVRNWVIVVPGIVLGLIGGALSFAVMLAIYGWVIVGGAATADVTAVTQTIVAVAFTIISLLASIVQMAYVTGMAGSAWRHGSTSLKDGWYAFSHRSIQTTIAVFLLFAIGVGAAALSPITFGVTLFVYIIFFIYTMASVVIGGREAIAGIAESCGLALANFWPTFGVVALIVVIAVAGGWAGSVLSHAAMWAGGIVAGVLEQIIVAYASLVVAGEYLKLSKRPEV